MHVSKPNREYDLIVVGGGIYGIMLALEAARRRRRVLLLERRDWGSGTTFSWLRIVHGGLRYLQSADLARFYESVGERSWFLENFPDYVRPIRCIMPLYRNGAHSVFTMRAALAVNDLLSAHRNRRLTVAQSLPNGSIIAPENVRELLPFVEPDGLVGGASWSDAFAIEPQQLLMQLLEWCSQCGVERHNYADVSRIETERSAVTGVSVAFPDSKRQRRFSAPHVVNATGHEIAKTVSKAGATISPLPGRSWAWNVLFDVPYAGTCAAAINAPERGSQTFFAVPWQGRVLVGTGHAAISKPADEVRLTRSLVRDFIGEAARAAPNLGLTEERIARVFSGYLPVVPGAPDKLTSRPLIVDPSDTGISGLYSVWGVKFTTARAVASRLVDRVVGKLEEKPISYSELRENQSSISLCRDGLKQSCADSLDHRQAMCLRSLAQSSDVRHLDDLLLRRCNLGDFPPDALELSKPVANALHWDEDRKREEVDRFESIAANAAPEPLSDVSSQQRLCGNNAVSE